MSEIRFEVHVLLSNNGYLFKRNTLGGSHSIRLSFMGKDVLLFCLFPNRKNGYFPRVFLLFVFSEIIVGTKVCGSCLRVKWGIFYLKE